MDGDKSINKESIISEIWQHSHHMGNILFHLEYTRREDGMGAFFLIPMLAILAEKSIKMYLSDKIEGSDHEAVFKKNISPLIKILLNKKVINQLEYSILTELREMRNVYCHDSEYSVGLDVNGVMYMFSENGTHQYIYDRLSLPVIIIILKLLKL